jgi:tetrahydromethanopterin S-methyltransferase subunit G
MVQRINDLALSLPDKYVNKNDFENLVKVVHHRFDRIEEKLDSLKK